LLIEAGVERVITVKFDNDMALLSRERFVLDVLSQHFEAQSIVVGENFAFTESHAVSGAQFAAIGARAGASVEIIPPSCVPGGDEIVTADYLKSRLADGDVKTVSRLLGRRWTLEGNVVHGDKRGRELGFPTANLAFRNDIRLGLGIYAVRLLINGHIANGVASYGTRPQFDNGAPRLEIYVLDFVGDLYGAHLFVEFVAFQRHERVFSDLGALLRQMHVDCQEARRLLADDLRDPSIESVLERRMRLNETSVVQ
jgi:riboflavin kinase/FMN adenylyltransferase